MPDGRLARALPWLGWTAVFASVASLLQVLVPSFFDGDTGYHLAVARLTRNYGLLHAFPWTPFSWLDANYADKELVFHLLLLPLADLDPTLAARLAGAFLGTGLLLVVYAILRAERVPSAGFWALAPLALTSAFVARFVMVRPHLLSVALALVVTWAAARRRVVLLGVAAFLYPLCYTAWHLPLVLVAVVEAARRLAGRRLEPRVLLVAAVGLALGVVVHPNFPKTVELFWIQNARVVGAAWSRAPGVDLGGEFDPFSPTGLLRYVALPAALAAWALVLAWRNRERSPLALAFALAAVAFLAITLRTQRFVEYLAPFAAVSAGLVVGGRTAAWKGAISPRAVAAAVVAVGVVHIAAFGRHPIELLRGRVAPFPDRVAELIGDLVPAGAQVVTCDWRLTGEMMLALPERKFVVALDPLFFAVQDPERYRLWFETIHAPPAEPAVLLRDAFDAGWVLCGEQERWRPFHRAMQEDPAAALRGVVGLWRVYQLRPPSQDPRALSRERLASEAGS